MSEYLFTEHELNELKELFFSEAYEILQTLDQEVLSVEAGKDRAVALKNIQRNYHTLKGNSRALGFDCLNTLTHKSEDLVKTIQDASLAVDSRLLDLLFAINDCLRLAVDGYRTNANVVLDNRLIERIERHLQADGSGEPGGKEIPKGDAPQGPQRLLVRDEVSSTLRVDPQRVDKILNLVGELVIGRSIIGQVISELRERYRKDELVKRLGDVNAFMEKNLSELQKHTMKIRMLPIIQVFRKFPRVVRDLSHEKKKQIELVMVGEKTELDKSILDAIGEPLIHLVRNSVDHGIELPDERERAGKPRTGKITLSAFHEANQIVLTISDDGGGLDAERIKQKAVERGIKTWEEVSRLSDEAVHELIFVSGFSTATVVTDISGRGLGLDIVRAEVESLKGKIDVRSRPGKGTTFTLRLPLTLAIIRAMMFQVGTRLFALPMSCVEKIIRIKDSDIQTISEKRVLRFRDSVISLVPINESLRIRDGQNDRDQNAFIIMVKLGDMLYGFMVDKLMGQQELVIKSLDDHWGTITCTSGASILGNGRVVLILDAQALITKEIERRAGIRKQPEARTERQESADENLHG